MPFFFSGLPFLIGPKKYLIYRITEFEELIRFQWIKFEGSRHSGDTLVFAQIPACMQTNTHSVLPLILLALTSARLYGRMEGNRRGGGAGGGGGGGGGVCK